MQKAAGLAYVQDFAACTTDEARAQCRQAYENMVAVFDAERAAARTSYESAKKAVLDNVTSMKEAYETEKQAWDVKLKDLNNTFNEYTAAIKWSYLGKKDAISKDDFKQTKHEKVLQSPY